MPGDKKITISVEAESKGFDQPIQGVRKLSDEVTKLNKVIHVSGQPSGGKQPGLLGRLLGGSKQNDTFSKQINSDIKELRNFQNVIQQTGRVLDQSLTQQFEKSRRALASVIKEQADLISQQAEIKNQLVDVKGDSQHSRLVKKQMLEQDLADTNARIAANSDRLQAARNQAAGDKEARDANRRENKIKGEAEPDDGLGPSGFWKGVGKVGMGLRVANMALDAGSAGMNAAITASLAPSEFRARSAQLGGSLYSEIASGNFASMAALMKDSQGNLANINSQDSTLSRAYGVGEMAAHASSMDAASGVISGGLSTGVSTVSGGLLGGGVGSGLNQIAQGSAALANPGLARDAARTQTILRTMNAARGADPIFDIVAQNAFSKSKAYSRHSRKVGGFDAMGDAIYDGADEGLHDNEVMDLQMNLRNRIGETRGNQLFETAAKSERMYGVDRNLAAGALTSLTEGSGGNANQAKQQWEELMSRAFSKGIKDSRLKDEIAAAVESSGYGAGGKFDASAIGEMMKNMLNGNSSAMDAKIARDSVSFSERFFGPGSTGQHGLDVTKVAAAGKDMAAVIAESDLIKGKDGKAMKGLKDNFHFHTALANMTIPEQEAGGNDQIAHLLGYEGGFKDMPNQVRALITDTGRNYRGNVSSVVAKDTVNDSITNDFTSIVQKAMEKKGTLQGKKLNLASARKELAGDPALRNFMTPDEQRQITSYRATIATANAEVGNGKYLEAFGSSDAMAGGVDYSTQVSRAPSGQQTPKSLPDTINQGQAVAAADLFAKMSDPKNVAALEAAAQASVSLMQNLSKLSPAQLGDPGRVLGEAAGAMKALTDAAGDFVRKVGPGLTAAGYKVGNR